MGPCALFWGGASSAQIATLGIPQDLTSKSDHNTGEVGRGACLEGSRSQQGSPGGRASVEACGILFGPLPMNLTGPGFSSPPPPRRALGPNPSLCWLSLRLPPRSCGEALPNTTVGRFLESSTGVAAQ